MPSKMGIRISCCACWL